MQIDESVIEGQDEGEADGEDDEDEEADSNVDYAIDLPPVRKHATFKIRADERLIIACEAGLFTVDEYDKGASLTNKKSERDLNKPIRNIARLIETNPALFTSATGDSLQTYSTPTPMMTGACKVPTAMESVNSQSLSNSVE